jgi:hypothetical protein
MVVERWGIEVLEEVRSWLDGLPVNQRARAEAMIDLLAEMGELLPFPYSSHLRGKLRELRLQFGRERERITYYPASGRRFVLLTVFRKTRRQESAEIDRAERAMKTHEGSQR